LADETQGVELESNVCVHCNKNLKIKLKFFLGDKAAVA
jgi:hypothetical protein